MLYEPGNWGDWLKAFWLVEILNRLAALAGPARVLRYADPFAGAPTYPLTEAAQGRFLSLGKTALDPLLQPFVERRTWPSASSIALEWARQGNIDLQAHVFDLDGQRRAAWEALSPTLLKTSENCGWDWIGRLSDGSPNPSSEALDLIVVDPYDLDRSSRWAAAERLLRRKPGALLFYMFNRSPRNPGIFAEYRAMRRRFTAAFGAEPRVGRVPADGCLPRAWHEVLLFAPPGLLPGEGARLRDLTLDLANHILAPGIFEPGSTGRDQEEPGHADV